MMHMDPVSARQVVRGYLVLPHAVPIIVVMTATAAFALLAGDGWPGLSPMIRLLGAMFGAQIAIGAINELADAELDAIAKPNKPIAAGIVTRRGARIVAAVGLVLMIMLSLTFGIGPFLLCLLGTGAGIAYSLWFKRTIWSWVPYLVGLPLLPIWVWASLSEVDAGIFAIYPIGAAAVIAVQLAQSLPDIAADRETDVRTLAVMLGPARARRVCWAALALAALLAVLASPLTNHPARIWVAAGLALGAIGVNAALWWRDAQLGVLACFPCIAVGAVVLGIGWTAALPSS
jgi:4-hydroxybenzoate polyprenyltransferase